MQVRTFCSSASSQLQLQSQVTVARNLSLVLKHHLTGHIHVWLLSFLQIERMLWYIHTHWYYKLGIQTKWMVKVQHLQSPHSQIWTHTHIYSISISVSLFHCFSQVSWSNLTSKNHAMPCFRNHNEPLLAIEGIHGRIENGNHRTMVKPWLCTARTTLHHSPPCSAMPCLEPGHDVRQTYLLHPGSQNCSTRVS